MQLHDSQVVSAMHANLNSSIDETMCVYFIACVHIKSSLSVIMCFLCLHEPCIHQLVILSLDDFIEHMPASIDVSLSK